MTLSLRSITQGRLRAWAKCLASLGVSSFGLSGAVIPTLSLKNKNRATRVGHEVMRRQNESHPTRKRRALDGARSVIGFPNKKQVINKDENNKGCPL